MMTVFARVANQMTSILKQSSHLRSIASTLLALADEMDSLSSLQTLDGSPTLPDNSLLLHDKSEKRSDLIYDDLKCLKHIAQEEYDLRRARDRFFDSELFGEATWDILLDLFIAKVDCRSITVSSACIASSVPPTTALRWLKVLEGFALVERTRNPTDSRSSFVNLTKFGFEAMQAYLRHAAKKRKYSPYPVKDIK